jgi:hypothetical protein
MVTLYWGNASATTTSSTCVTSLWIYGGTSTTTANVWYAARRGAAEAQAHRAQEQERSEAARLKQEQERWETARARAHALLLSHLTPAQRQTFEINKWFIVEGGRSKAKYRIRGHACAGNVELLDGERVTHRLCCHCGPTIPLGDQLLTQKLMLELDEEEFLKLANRYAA